MEANTGNINPSNLPARLDKDGNVNVTALTPAEVQKFESINKKLVPSDVNSILNYGSEAQNSMEKYSNEFLATVRTQ
ncbi:MAG TPA: hypothetical protein VF623_10340, partial [Segetibacter sp.]